MSDEKFIKQCEICGNNYQHGPHRYEGHLCELYDLWVCDACWEGNWDGWNPRLEPILLAHLRKKDLPIPNRNEKELFPRE